MGQTSPLAALDLATIVASSGWPGALWSALAQHPFVGLQVVTVDGTIRYANDQAMKLFFGPKAKAAEYVGRNASEWTPRDALEERLGVVRDAVRDQRAQLCRGIHQGRQIVSRLLPIKLHVAAMPMDAVIVVSMRVEGATAELDELAGLGEYVEAKAVDWGPLAALSKRELEVLALIGEGLSMAQIAEVLHRSPHTVHDHRKSIGRKLGLDDRVRLAALARGAGLRPDDATRERMRYFNNEVTPEV